MSTVALTTQQDTGDQTSASLPDLELRGYAHALQEWLESADSLATFKRNITNELNRLGFTDWSYERLDMPLLARKPIGTFHQGDYYKYMLGPDLMHDHIAMTTDKSPVFRSTVVEFLQQLPIEIAAQRQTRALYDHYESLGYYDSVGIPLYSGDQNSHAVFTVAANGKDTAYLKQTFSSCENKVQIIARTVEEIGNETYRELFIGVKESYEQILHSNPMKLLAAMAHNDCGIEEAAKTIDISRAAADKQLARIRHWLGVNTNHRAVFEAIKLGLICCDKLSN